MILSMAGFAARDIDFPALATLEGSCPARRRGFAADTASLAVLLSNASAIALNIQSGALSKLSSDAYSYRARARSSSESMVVTMPAPFLYASAASLLTRGSASTGAVMIRSCSGWRFKPTLIETSARRSNISGSKGNSLSASAFITRVDTMLRLNV